MGGIQAEQKNTPVDLADLRASLRSAIEHHVYADKKTKPFVSPFGTIPKWSFDFRTLLLSGDTLDNIAELFWQEMGEQTPFQVGGLETAAIALISGIVMKAKADGVSLKGFYVRKSRRRDGFQKHIEGNLGNEKVILVDDALNSGRSMMRQVVALEAEGKAVSALWVIVRCQKLEYYSFFHERGIKIHSLFTLDDVPQTGGLLKNAFATSIKPNSAFTVEWKFTSPNPAYFHVIPKSAPAIDTERIYFGADNGAMWALNQNDGSVAWQYQTLFGAGKKRIFSSPLLFDSTLYFGAYDGNFYALDAKTGKKKWMYMEADWIGSSPCAASDLGLVYAGLEFGLWKKRGALVALDAKGGEKRWWQSVPSLVHSSPLYLPRPRIVACGSSKGIAYAFDAMSGEPRWTYKTNGAIRGGFAYDESRDLLCFGSEDRYLYVLKGTTGELVYKIETFESVYTTPLVDSGRLFCGLLDKRMICIDLDLGTTPWEFWTHGRIFSTPIIVDGKLFFGANDGRFYELDAETGREIGYFQASERIVNKAAYNSATVKFFVPTYANEVYCLARKSPHPTITV